MFLIDKKRLNYSINAYLKKKSHKALEQYDNE